MKIVDVPASILNLLSMAEACGAAHPWGQPEDIKHSALPVPPFDLAMLPDAIRPWVEDIAHRMQCPIDFVAVAAVTMLGSVIGTGCGIRPKQKDNWLEVPNLWGAVVGRPGGRKSPAISAAMKPLHVLDREAQDTHRAALRVHEQSKLRKKMELDISKKALTKNGAVPTDAQMDALAKLIEEDDEPACRRFFTNDCTIEMLGEILRENQRGMLTLHDELMGLLGGFEKSGRQGERPFYLTAWDGRSSHRVDRIGRGELYIPRLAASLFGGIQPAKLEQYLYEMQQGNGSDGFIQRFQLMVFPDEVEITTVIDELPDQAAEDRVMNLVTVLAHCDFASRGATIEESGQTPFFRFDLKKATPVFNKWLLELDRSVLNQDEPLMQQHLSKYRKLVPALALIFHLVEVTAPSEKRKKVVRHVGVANLCRALQWAEHLEAHARRIYGMGTDYRVQMAQALAKKIEAGALLTASMTAMSIAMAGRGSRTLRM